MADGTFGGSMDPNWTSGMDWSGTSALGGPLGTPTGGWTLSQMSPDKPSAMALQLQAEQEERDRLARQQMQQMASGGNDYYQTMLQSQAAGQQYAVPGFQNASLGRSATAPSPLAQTTMYTKPYAAPNDGSMMYAGGSPLFDERTGQYGSPTTSPVYRGYETQAPSLMQSVDSSTGSDWGNLNGWNQSWWNGWGT